MRYPGVYPSNQFTEEVKVGGETYEGLLECLEWINTRTKQVLVFLDRMLEYPGKIISKIKNKI